jgi:lipid-A-disaccharide synthase-like uncharacterized protein
MDEMMIIGMLGSLLILAAWAFEAVESIREHKALVDLRFSFIYLAGVIALDAYSVLIGDPVFTFLNFAITAVIGAEILYTLWKFKRRKP